MDRVWKEALWRQFGAAIDMLEGAIVQCPDSLWSDRSRRPEYWYVVYHTIFWLDYYLCESPEAYAPPPPFTTSEFDPSGRLPDRVYTQEELRAFLEHGRRRCRETIAALTEERARRPIQFVSVGGTTLEMLFYNLRHVQHHVGQLYLILREVVDATPGWVGAARVPLELAGSPVAKKEAP